MKLINFAKLLPALAMFLSVSANAGIITVSGNAFDDRGSSTIDLSSQLEWRDVNLTFGRSLCSIAKDAGGAVPGGCDSFDNQNLIADSEGWRIATRGEVSQLLSDWMGIPVGPQNSYTVSSALTNQFINVFAGQAGSSIRPDFAPDTSNPTQAVGFFLSSGNFTTNFYNGSINESCCNQGAMLVRQAPVNLPEPGPLALVGIALIGLRFARSRR